MDAQEQISGATSGGCANEVSNYEEGMVAERRLFHRQLELKQVMADNFYHP